MRVIAGNLRGRVIKTIPGKNTRPTLDNVKEAMFNLLGQFFTGGKCLDLFSGSGSLGIEAISRGCDSCVFVERNYLAMKIIKENLQALGLDSKCEVYKMDVFKAINLLNKKGEKFDYIFLDPPYEKQNIDKVLQMLIDQDLLNKSGKIIVECVKTTELITSYQDLQIEKEKTYGITKIIIYKKYGDESD